MKKQFILATWLITLTGMFAGFAMANQTVSTPDVKAKIQIVPANDPLKISGGYVTFQPKARTTWHTHPKWTNVNRNGR